MKPVFLPEPFDPSDLHIAYAQLNDYERADLDRQMEILQEVGGIGKLGALELAAALGRLMLRRPELF